MNLHWKNRPKTYLVDSEINTHYDGVEIINAGPESEWSRKVQYALEIIDTPYVLLMLEDFFIACDVDNEVVKTAIDTVKKYDIKFYQVLVQALNQGWAKGDAFMGNKRIHIAAKEKRYAINLQAAIWNAEFLRKMVGEGNYNAWEFEIKQLGKSDFNSEKAEILVDDRNMLHIIHAVVQSKYLPGAIRKLKKKGYDLDTKERGVLGFRENFNYNFKLLMYSITPKILIKPFKAVGRFMKVDFVTDRIKIKEKER